ncbi:hypothetical protein [Microbacterium cremeum]|uniref:hypothetical protein n=1 Tax=Microbacterium cremeum TaxID=2782169 RepID=UPI0018888A7B|nr:hypothetical protein [Microbacterium cremeum]
MDIITLERFARRSDIDALETTAREHELTNVFNASLAVFGGSTFIAFRAESFPGERPFRAYVAEYVDGREAALLDMTSEDAGHGVKTADPKLVELGDALYVTYNTGNVHVGENDIYLQRVAPAPGPAQRCVLAARRPVEKNWGFFTSPDGSVGVLYSLAPAKVLELAAGTLGEDEELVFTPRIEEAELPHRFPRLHIGSQPVIVGGTTALVAANQQRPIPGLPRKVYFGRLAEFDLRTGRLDRLSRRGLLHSWRAALPQRKRHNPGLLSATYFAGLARTHSGFVLSYGVNDLAFGIAHVPEHVVWR